MIVLEWLGITIDFDFVALIWEFEALMISGRGNLHGMNPWAIKENVEGKIEINDVA